MTGKNLIYLTHSLFRIAYFYTSYLGLDKK